MSTQLSSTGNTSMTAPVIPHFSPTPSAIRVNIFWFMSLILSLTTVVVGIVSLQWLREHQRYPNYLPPQETFARHTLRSKALEAWHVPQVFTALPMLLQAALVLFFTGIIDFLLALNQEVAGPVVALVALSLLFLLTTTVLAPLQFLRPKLLPQSQCPYKSPQSWAFLRLTIVIVDFVKPIFLHARMNIFKLIQTGGKPRLPSKPERPAFRRAVLSSASRWTECEWSSTGNNGPERLVAKEMISVFMHRFGHDGSLFSAMYHCFQDIFAYANSVNTLNAHSWQHVISPFMPRRLCVHKDESNRLLAIQFLLQSNYKPAIETHRAFRMHLIELFMRTTSEFLLDPDFKASLDFATPEGRDAGRALFDVSYIDTVYVL
ncbi:hypothetical protein B0H34DRAFT_275066 [Crassisporium funariophilum]|nr:hypothetical protein B0H34DRAFT_275066 [Crassisporium funariophilum]